MILATTAGTVGAEATHLNVPASIDEAMDGVTSVVLVSPAVVAQELNVVTSAARAGVGHIVKASSTASADSPIARRRGQFEIEKGLTASGVLIALGDAEWLSQDVESVLGRAPRSFAAFAIDHAQAFE